MARPRGPVARFDASVDRAFDRLRGRTWADRVFYAASALGDHGTLWLILAGLRAVRGGTGWNRQAAVRAAAGVGIESAIVNLGIKSLFRRVRPVSTSPHPRPFRQPRTSSFPSGHASSAFCAAELLGEDDALRPLYYGLAVVVATSRIYVRIHHASDVAAGAVLGAAMGRLGRKLAPLGAPPPWRRESPAGARRF
ncbi:MAG: phosphatase PAP2 family protein [Acidimicrobiales bacterium]